MVFDLPPQKRRQGLFEIVRQELLIAPAVHASPLSPRTALHSVRRRFKSFASSMRPRLMRDFTVPSGIARIDSHFFVAHPLQIPENDRLTQLRGKAVDDLAEPAREVFLFERAVRIVRGLRVSCHGHQLFGFLAVDHHRAFPPPPSVVIDGVVARDPLEPGGKTPARVEGAQGGQQMEEDLLSELLRLVRSPGELKRDIPHLSLEAFDESLPGVLVAARASPRELSVF